MKNLLLASVMTLATSVSMARIMVSTCKTLGGKEIEISVNDSVSPKKLEALKINGSKILSDVNFNGGSRGGYTLTVSGITFQMNYGQGISQKSSSGDMQILTCTSKIEDEQKREEF